MPVYSHSRLSSYENCPMQYKFQYVDNVQLEQEVETVEAFMGSRVHETLEKLYRDIKLSKENSLDDLLAFYSDIWDKEWSDDIKVVRQDYSPENYHNTGAKCINEYYNRYHPFADTKTLGLEQIIFIEIEGYKLKGFIDRLAQRKDGYYEIHDYKTSQHLPTKKYLEKERQLALYQIGVEELWEDSKEVDLIWHFLVHDKELRLRKSREDIEKLKGEIVKLIQEIENATEETDFPAKESQLCDWCEFQVLCPKRKHLVETEAMPLNQYLKDPGVKLVNEYAQLMEKKREFLEDIESQLKQLEEAIIAFVTKEGVEVVRGSDKKLTVKKYSKSKFPKKGENGREELEELLRASGKWMEISDINLYSLAKVVAKGGWNPRLVEKINNYCELEESYRLTLSTIKEREE